MSGLAPEDKALLDLARSGHEPTHSDRARVRAGVFAGLGVGAGLSLTTATSASGAALVTKVLAAIAVASAIGGGSLVAYKASQASPALTVASSSGPFRVQGTLGPPMPHSQPPTEQETANADRESAARQPSPSQRPAAPEPPRPPAPAPKIQQSPGMPAAPTTPEPSALPPQTSRPDEAGPTKGAPPSVAEVLPAPTASTSVEDEMRLVAGGVAALHAGDAARALSLLEEHAREYPNGVLAEERASERVRALCTLGRSGDARAAAREFLLAYPRSPLASRVRSSCAETPNP